MPSSLQRHFTFRHPLFRKQKSTSGEWWENSVYYFWWEFLRRHKGYRKTCENGGKGKYEKLYADFGNVHGITFKEWWTKGGRGVRLFSEPPLPTNITELNPHDIPALSENWKPGSVLIVAIPLILRKRFILQKFNKLLAKHHKRRRGQRTFRDSQAPYPIASQFNRHSLKKILQAYDMRQPQPRLALWEIAQRLALGTKLTTDELAGKNSKESIVHRKSVLAIAASKKLALAKNIIDGVGYGRFPVFTKSK
jgi:hypothetical protein